MMDFISPFGLKILQRTDGRNIIALISGKGENGKTWVSIAMAGILARMGQRVLLFDGDLGLANIDMQLGITQSQDIASVLMAKVPMNKAIVSYEQGGFDVLTGRCVSDSLQSVDYGSLQLIKDDLLLLASHYDTVIMDLGSSSDMVTRVFSEAVGTILLFCTDEHTSLTQARGLLEMLSNDGCLDKVGIVVNAVSSLKEGNRTYYTLIKACDDFIKDSPLLFGVIRKDFSVLQALENQFSVLNTYPDCIAIQDVKELVKKLKKE